MGIIDVPIGNSSAGTDATCGVTTMNENDRFPIQGELSDHDQELTDLRG
jgi:hypothetical protein